jgi:endonuclease-3
MSRVTDSLPVFLARLRERYPRPAYALQWSTPLELLVATILAAQCTDERVNQVTTTLFRKYRSAPDYLNVSVDELSHDIPTISFNLKKAKRIQDVCRVLIANFNGQVPRTMDEMLTLPGVARKTANVVLNVAFNEPSGVIVDSHVERVSKRLPLSRFKTPERIERDLMAAVPREQWTWFGPALVLHGRHTCTARHPSCTDCVFNDLCEKVGLDEEE